MDPKAFQIAINNISRGQIKSLQEKLTASPDLIKANVDETTLLMEAVHSGKPQIVKLLLDLGADPNAPDSPGRRFTPLHSAVSHFNLDMVKMLIAKGAEVNAADSRGFTPLTMAVGFSADYGGDVKAAHEQIFFYLLEHRAAMHDPAELLWRAAVGGSASIARYILEKIGGQYPFSAAMQQAAREEEAALNQAMLQQLAGQINAGDKNAGFLKKLFGQAKKAAPKPRPAALKAKPDGVAKKLLEEIKQGAARVDQSRSALVAAAKYGHAEIVGLLLANGGAGGRGGLDGREALLAALERNNIECLKLIYPAVTSKEQQAADLKNQPPQAEIKKLAQSIYKANQATPSIAMAPKLPQDRIVAALTVYLAGFPLTCLSILDQSQSAGFRFLNAFLKELMADPANQAQAAPAPNEEEAAAMAGIMGGMFEEIQQYREEYVTNILLLNKTRALEARPLKDILAEIDARLAALDPRLLKLFAPPLAPEVAAALAGQAGLTLPPDLITLYSWHNGMAALDGAEALLAGYRFSPLAEALERSQHLTKSSLLPGHLFQFMSNVFGDWVDIDLRSKSGRLGLVCQVHNDGQDAPTVYAGLTAFLGALLAALNEKAFRAVPGAGPGGEDLLVGHHDHVDAVFSRYALISPDDEDGGDDGSADGFLPDFLLEEANDDGPGISDYDYQAALPR